MGIILILAILVLRASCTEDSEENFNNSSTKNLSSEKGSVKHSETNNHPSQVEDNNSSGQEDSRTTDSRTATDEQRANQNNSDSGKQAAQTSTDTDNSFQKHDNDNDNNSQEPSETNDETDDATIELDEDFDKMIDEFDFEVDEIDLEHIDLQANTIPPNAWLVIIDNVSKLAEKYKDQMKQEDKERMKKDLARLKELEGILSERGQQEFGKEDPKEAEECATIELLILNTIRSMKPDDQISALDIDHDGVADFSI